MTGLPGRDRAFVAAAAVALLVAAAPAPVETPATIRAAITAALQPRLAGLADATAEIGAIDARLRLPACPAIAVALPETGGAALTAKVSCAQPNWTLYVPIRLHAFVTAVTAATNIAANTRLTGDELASGRVDLMSFAGRPMTDPADVAGKVLRVGVVAGAPILASYLEQPIVVHRGQKVLVTLSDGTMTVRNTAVALEDGRVGEQIRAENPDSHRIVHATVDADGGLEMRF